MKRDYIITGAIGLLPDLALAWLYVHLIDGTTKDFWTALLVIYGLQAFLSVKKVLAETLAFRLYAKRRIVEMAKKYFTDSELPPSERGEDAYAYLLRLSNDNSLPLASRFVANAELARMKQLEANGFFAALRVTSAYDEAVAQYCR